MVSEPIVEVTFALDDADDYERQEFAKKLLKQLREQGDAEAVERTEDLNPEKLGKGGLDKIPGMLTAIVKFCKIVGFFGFLSEKFAEKPIEVHVKVGDREATIKTTGAKAALIGEQIANGLLETMSKNKDIANG
ncbi:hypothetical protein TUMEXPCC7403_17235 [Tumidithrix helvetica PCC 7403]|uniref:hypothetical protein n=1 Tax=Tumidithrix helvetica TaxID=3457545 RepID=UPI003CC1D8B5